MESDSSVYLTNCCDFEFIGKENDPFYKTLYKAHNKVICSNCGKAFEPSEAFKCGIDKDKFLYRYKRSKE